jgi:hypothetical protein
MLLQKLVLGSFSAKALAKAEIRRRFANKLSIKDTIFFLSEYGEKKYLLIEGR